MVTFAGYISKEYAISKFRIAGSHWVQEISRTEHVKRQDPLSICSRWANPKRCGIYQFVQHSSPASHIASDQMFLLSHVLETLKGLSMSKESRKIEAYEQLLGQKERETPIDYEGGSFRRRMPRYSVDVVAWYLLAIAWILLVLVIRDTERPSISVSHRCESTVPSETCWCC